MASVVVVIVYISKLYHFYEEIPCTVFSGRQSTKATTRNQSLGFRASKETNAPLIFNPIRQLKPATFLNTVGFHFLLIIVFLFRFDFIAFYSPMRSGPLTCRRP